MSRILSPLHAVVAASVVMVAVSAWRWHSYHLRRPEGVPGASAGVVAVLQPRDCPDSQERAERFLAFASRQEIPTLVVRMSADSWSWGLTTYVRGWREARAHRGLHRAILRSGLAATPAMLLLDHRGFVRFVYRVEPDASDDLLAESATAFASAYRLLLAEADLAEGSSASPVLALDPEEAP